MNSKLTRLRQMVLGVVLGGLLTASVPKPVVAQWTVYDPANHATAIEHKIEDWLHWVQQLQDNIRKIELLVKQWTTMKDVLVNAEKLVAHNVTWAATMASIGNSIRGIYRLKSSLINLVRYRVRALISIRNRLKNGLFNPSADLEDLEEYLRDGLGRASVARIATLERLASFDVTLQTLYERWSEACARRAGLEKEKTELEARHEAAVARGDAPDAIASIEEQLQMVDSKLIEINKLIDELWTEMTERAKKYHVHLEARQRAGRQAAEMAVAWDDFFVIKQEFIDTLEEYAANYDRQRQRWMSPPTNEPVLDLPPPIAIGGGADDGQ